MTVEGERLDDLLDRKEKLSFDPENFSALILASFLTIPSDNKPDNFMVTYDRSRGEIVAKLVGIDNDMVFAYPLTSVNSKGGQKEHLVSLKNGLYFFDQMMNRPIDPKVRDRIGKLNPLLLGIEWAAAVAEQDRRYEMLSITKENQASLPLRFTPSTLHNLIENLQTLQKILSDPSTKFVTHQELFRHLFPVVERFYRGLAKDMGSTKEKIENLFSIGLPPVEKYLNLKEPLEDGRTVADALQFESRTAKAHREERTASIEDLTLDILATTDLALLAPKDQAALLNIAASNFSQFANKEDLHLSWRSNELVHLVVKEGCNQKTLQFIKRLGVDLATLDEQQETILFSMVRYYDLLSLDLLQQFPLETKNTNGLTVLDIAMTEKSIPSFKILIRAGAGINASSTAALSFYNEVVKGSADSELQQSFQRLIQLNGLLYWKMALETILPKQCEKGIAVDSALNGIRMLTPEAAKQLWKDSGEFNSVNTFGRRAVGKVTIGRFTLYFKQAPELPGLEQAVGTLTHQVMGFGTPHTDLVNIKGIPYLVSQAIDGPNLQDVIKKDPAQLAQLDKQRLSQLLLMTMLINPEDGKPDNYIVQPIPNQEGYQLVSIDNDHAFVPSVAKEKLFQNKKNRVQVKTILYCLDQMNSPIDPKVRDQFLNHDPAEILCSWLGHLSAVHSLYSNLFTAEMRNRLFNIHGTYVGIPFRPEIVTSLYRKMVQMQFLLSKHQDNPNYSHLEMLLEVDPPLGNRYLQSFKNKALKTALDRFRIVDGADYDMKGGSFISTRQGREILHSQNIVTKAEMKDLLKDSEQLNPIEALESLHQVITADQSQLAKRLMGAGGAKVDFASLTDEQATSILRKIDFSTLPPPIVQSILNQLYQVPFRELPLSHASTVTNKSLSRFNFSYLTALDLSYCQQLTEGVVEQILKSAPQIKKLNLSGISSFRKIHGPRKNLVFTPLFPTKYYILFIQLQNITHLYLNHCKNLSVLFLQGDHLAVVECEGNALKRLGIISKTLSNLSLKNNELFDEVSLDVVAVFCPNLRRLKLEGCNQITKKELREKFPSYPFGLFSKIRDEGLKENIISLLENKITTLDLASQNYGDNEAAIALALRCNSSLQTLDLSSNKIGDSGATALTEALTSNSSLQTLDLSRNKMIGYSGVAPALLGFSRDQMNCFRRETKSEKPSDLQDVSPTKDQETLEPILYSPAPIEGVYFWNVRLDKIFLTLNKSKMLDSVEAFLSIFEQPLRMRDTSTLSHEKFLEEWPQLDETHFSLICNHFNCSLCIWTFGESSNSLTLKFHQVMSGSQTVHLLQVGEGFTLLEPTIDGIEETGRESSPETLFLKGKVLEYRDKQEAIETYLQAATLGHKEALERLEALSSESHHALYAMGCYYESKKDIKQAVAYFTKGASYSHFQAKQALHHLAKGDSFAKANLAILMQHGLGMTRDIEKALEMHKEAAANGEALSKLHLGILYHQGFSSESDKERALDLVKEAEKLGFSQATEVRIQILKEQQEIKERANSSKPIEEALWAIKRGDTLNEIHQLRSDSEKAALAKSRQQRLIESEMQFESRKSDLAEQIKFREELKKNATPTEKAQLDRQIDGLEQEIDVLEKEHMAQLTLDPVEEARRHLLNQKRALFYKAFKQKIEEVFNVSEAILSGKVARNVSLSELGATSAIKSVAGYAVKIGVKEAAKLVPVVGSAAVALTEFTVGKVISSAKEDKIKKQCRKVQSYFPEEGSAGISKLSSLLARGLTYRFQEQLTHLDGESLERLAEHFALSFGNYLYEKAPHGATNYELLTLASLNQFESLKERFQRKPLKTDDGFEIAVNDLMLSTGVRTPYGGKFLPKDPKRRETISHLEEKRISTYRYGTKEEIDLLYDMGIEMECKEQERIGILVTSIDSKKAAARFMREAEGLADQYMT
jgi:hypothetical protein